MSNFSLIFYSSPQHNLVMSKVSLDPQGALAQRLRQLRSGRKLRQTDVASAVNISSRTYSNYERAYRMPDLRILSSLADFFNVSTDYLLGRTTLHFCYPPNREALLNMTQANEVFFKVADSQLETDDLYKESPSDQEDD